MGTVEGIVFLGRLMQQKVSHSAAINLPKAHSLSPPVLYSVLCFIMESLNTSTKERESNSKRKHSFGSFSWIFGEVRFLLG